jgi:type II secretory pathway pseudopilin PulG
MVITIIGMLMALLVAGAMRAVNTAKIARITVEVGMLDTAVQNYKNEIGGSYPPDFTYLGTTTGTPDWIGARNNRILAHLRKAFPRFYVNGYGTGATQGTLQYAVQQAFVAYNATNPPAKYLATTPNGASTWGDLNNLDAAEALVFWLGGLPDVPVQDQKTLLWSYRLKGFSANKMKPFDLIGSSRLKGPFEFQEQRLGDADGDGWPEFYPQVDAVPQPTGSGVTSVGNPTAPYVYFDSGSYTSVTPAAGFAAYPASGQYPPFSSGSMPTAPTNAYASQWGAAIPYANAYNASSTPAQLTWLNPEKFQIVAAGIDSMYWSPPITGTTPGPDDFRVFPGGTNYSPADNDNVTNFSNGKLQDFIP